MILESEVFPSVMSEAIEGVLRKYMCAQVFSDTQSACGLSGSSGVLQAKVLLMLEVFR